MALSTDTDGTQTQTTRCKTLLFCHISCQKFRPPSASKMGREVPKTLKTSSSAHYFFFFDDRATDGRKHIAQTRWIEILKNVHFFDVHFSLGEKHILETRCIKQHAIFVDPLGVSYDFSNAHTLMFYFPEVESSKQERRNRFGHFLPNSCLARKNM